jgi:hypothetical protein
VVFFQGSPDAGSPRPEIHGKLNETWWEAHAEVAEVLRLNPKFSVKKLAKILPVRDKAVKERYIDALRKAGLPD